MKHKDYTKFSENNENKFQNNPAQPEEQNMVPPVDNQEQPEEPVTNPDTNPELENNENINQNNPEENKPNQATNLLAIVTKCSRLNVRKEADKNSKVVCVIANGNEVTVDLDASTEDFYKVHTVVNDVLVEGYCAKEFIEIK